MLEKLIQSSLITVVEGERNSGKLVFSLFVLKHILKKDAIFITAMEKSLFERKIKVFEERFHFLKNINKLLCPFILKCGWSILKKQYSYALFEEELKKIFKENSSKIVLFHHFDQFFELHDRFEIESLVRLLIQLATEYDKQIIITIATSDINYDFMNNIMYDFSELVLKLDEKNVNEHRIQVMHSLQKINNTVFRLKSNDDNLRLEEYNEKNFPIAVKTYLKVLIISPEEKKPQALQMIEYILSEKVMFEVTYASSIDEIFQEVFLKPDLIFFFIKYESFNKEAYKNLKLFLPDSSFFIFFLQDFIRTSDRREIIQLGFNEVFSLNFQVEDVISRIEKAVGDNFYSNLLQSFNSHNGFLKNKEDLHALMQEAYDKRIYFSLVVYRHNCSDQITFNSGRESDVIYHDQENMKTYYLALNTSSFIAKKISDRLKESGCEVTIESIGNAIDIKHCLEL